MPVNASRFLRKMRGGAQAHLFEAVDGHCYVVKFQNNPQHRRILINEVIASEILRQLEIAAPEHQLINISADFLLRHPEIYLQFGSSNQRVTPGWHFGSRFPGHPTETSVYDFLPDGMLSQVANVDQFLAVLVFDKWVANADGRQTIFFRAQLSDWLLRPGIPPKKAGFVVQMIDHGYAFNGPNWELPDSPLTGLYPRRTVYRKVTSLASFEPWVGRVKSFPVEAINRALRQIPPDWIAEDEAASLPSNGGPAPPARPHRRPLIAEPERFVQPLSPMGMKRSWN